MPATPFLHLSAGMIAATVLVSGGAVWYASQSTPQAGYVVLVVLQTLAWTGLLWLAKGARAAAVRNQEERARLKILFEHSPIAIWELDCSGLTAHLDALRAQGVENWGAYFDAHPQALPACAARVRTIHLNATGARLFQAADKAARCREPERHLAAAAPAVFRGMIIALAEGRQSFDAEYRITPPGGRPKTLLMSLAVVPGLRGKLDRVFVSCIDYAPQQEVDHHLRQAHDEMERRVVARTAELARESAEHRHAAEALRLSEARLAEAQAMAHLGNWNWDIRSGSLSWSDEIYRIFGLHPQAFGATYEAFLERVHPEDRALVRESVDRSLRALGPYAIDHRVLLPDGGIRFVHEQGEVRFDENGLPLRMIGTVQDVTERKVAEMTLLHSLREKEILLRELHHRVKNNLQVISSMLSLQARHIDPDNARQAFIDSRERIRGLAMVHERLYASGDLGRVDMTAHARYLATRLSRIYRKPGPAPQVTLRGASVHLDIGQAVPCALILHELLAYAFRHAFPDHTRPQVDIEVGTEADGGIRIELRDHGTTPAAWANRAADAGGLGLAIIQVLSGQLHASVRFDDASPGTRATLRIPRHDTFHAEEAT